MPGVGFLQQQVACKHHDKIYHGQNQEHLIDAAVSQIVQHCLHDGACDCLCRTEACNRQSGGKAFPVLKPQHQGLHRGQIAGTKPDAHEKAVAKVDTDEGQRALLMGASIIDEKAGACHTAGKADGSNQR